MRRGDRDRRGPRLRRLRARDQGRAGRPVRAGAHRAAPGGLFVFDLATPGRVPAGEESAFRVGDDWAILDAASESGGRMQRRITMFRRIGGGATYRRSEEIDRRASGRCARSTRCSARPIFASRSGAVTARALSPPVTGFSSHARLNQGLTWGRRPPVAPGLSSRRDADDRRQRFRDRLRPGRGWDGARARPRRRERRAHVAAAADRPCRRAHRGGLGRAGRRALLRPPSEASGSPASPTRWRA